ncbi:hypothetical protein JOQ06_025690 [Pogonophryne albipinna]|uniref:Uncharacterized protein n=1 Tax=Pogonophryne albipinna TaxID=1090488 RepID=A0AAD6ASX1_9TELE|nr:hypothetical protein JOQ06_025690 [Pogonophryne albipinna]
MPLSSAKCLHLNAGPVEKPYPYSFLLYMLSLVASLQKILNKKLMKIQMKSKTMMIKTIVIGRPMRQIKQIRKGLKDTMLWPLINQRPDAAPILFPQESSAVLTPESIIDRINWPTMIDVDDDECSLEDKSRVTEYLRRFIQDGIFPSCND